MASNFCGLEPTFLAQRRDSLPSRSSFRYQSSFISRLAALHHPEQNALMAHQLTCSYLKDSIDLFRHYKRLAERAIAQCPDQGLFATLDSESNSIAAIVKHISGNMKSRWTSLLTSDGEKPDRNRDSEFEDAPQTRAQLMELWEQGWKYLFDALEPLTDADLDRTVAIRGEPHSVMQAINRQIAHYSHHIGQILFAAKHFGTVANGKWDSLSVPRGQSQQFAADVRAGKKSQR
jgi:uncharacterized damage-inducible protein DinB